MSDWQRWVVQGWAYGASRRVISLNHALDGTPWWRLRRRARLRAARREARYERDMHLRVLAG